MSLDVWLTTKARVVRRAGTGVFIRDGGRTRELTLDEVRERWPDADVTSGEEYETDQVYSANITHNLDAMANAVGERFYQALWQPEEGGWQYTRDITPVLQAGLDELLADADRFKRFNPENGWGSYEGLVEFTENYLAACRQYPDAEINVWR